MTTLTQPQTQEEYVALGCYLMALAVKGRMEEPLAEMDSGEYLDTFADVVAETSTLDRDTVVACMRAYREARQSADLRKKV